MIDLLKKVTETKPTPTNDVYYINGWSKHIMQGRGQYKNGKPEYYQITLWSPSTTPIGKVWAIRTYDGIHFSTSYGPADAWDNKWTGRLNEGQASARVKEKLGKGYRYWNTYHPKAFLDSVKPEYRQ